MAAPAVRGAVLDGVRHGGGAGWRRRRLRGSRGCTPRRTPGPQPTNSSDDQADDRGDDLVRSPTSPHTMSKRSVWTRSTGTPMRGQGLLHRVHQRVWAADEVLEARVAASRAGALRRTSALTKPRSPVQASLGCESTRTTVRFGMLSRRAPRARSSNGQVVLVVGAVEQHDGAHVAALLHREDHRAQRRDADAAADEPVAGALLAVDGEHAVRAVDPGAGAGLDRGHDARPTSRRESLIVNDDVTCRRGDVSVGRQARSGAATWRRAYVPNPTQPNWPGSNVKPWWPTGRSTTVARRPRLARGSRRPPTARRQQLQRPDEPVAQEHADERDEVHRPTARASTGMRREAPDGHRCAPPPWPTRTMASTPCVALPQLVRGAQRACAAPRARRRAARR